MHGRRRLNHAGAAARLTMTFGITTCCRGCTAFGISASDLAELGEGEGLHSDEDGRGGDAFVFLHGRGRRCVGHGALGFDVPR
jgi:hypothetical protein